MTETTGTETRAPEKRWYVIHTYSGYENKVKAKLIFVLNAPVTFLYCTKYR
jgi:hypothetical protein